MDPSFGLPGSPGPNKRPFEGDANGASAASAPALAPGTSSEANAAQPSGASGVATSVVSTSSGDASKRPRFDTGNGSDVVMLEGGLATNDTHDDPHAMAKLATTLNPAPPALGKDGKPNPDDPLSVAKRLTTARRYLAAQTQAVIIPSYSTWFDLSTIHPIERRSLPEFFNSKNRSKTPSIYKDYRDFMIHTYRLNPSEYLTVTACRRNLAGDVCAIMRVHALLEQWGLINYQIDADTRPASLAPPFTGHFRILLDTPRGLAPLHPGSYHPIRSDTISTSGATNGRPDVRLSNAEAIQTASEAADASAATTNATDASTTGAQAPVPPCQTCGTSASATHYTSLSTRGQVVLCAPCYTEGRFPSSLHSGDFIKLERSPFAHSSRAEWTDQETLKLLEGLEMFDDDWDAVALHVGTRTKEQCIIKFIGLPIEDPYLETMQKELGALKYDRRELPFSKEDNPVMSVMSYLVDKVDRDVVKKMTAQGVQELERKLKEEVTTTNEGENASSDMQVEGASPAEEKSKTAPSNLAKASAVALSSAAVKAHSLAMTEDASLHQLVTSVVEAQVQKLQLKLQHFEQLERLLEVEKRAVEAAKQQLFEERMDLARKAEVVKEAYEKVKRDAKEVTEMDVEKVVKAMGGGAVEKLAEGEPTQAVEDAGPAPGVPEEATAQLS
ncbi:BQ5605_C007g04500 [Microbotryum silenes-dioicae]|uniref:BQ5605_C007g04500 protein n=1 Tax=Microbotryum silenes-dioicae TaxID=796604 RepID=A0A2X0M7A0_9BASI|nr:BQ5605_C007g04500 [Microbotryum silenes-dioicae]